MTRQWTVADLIYDATTHTTTTPDGTPVPHVTEVLRATGMSTDFDEVREISPRSARFVDRAGVRGRIVHAECHKLDDCDLDWAQVDPRVRPYVEAWERAREDLALEPLHRERRLYSAAVGVTGIMDGLFHSRGVLVLGDIKTGDPASAAADLQTAAYELMVREDVATFGIEKSTPIERISIHLVPGRRVPYRVNYHSRDPRAYLHQVIFRSCVTVYYEQRRRQNGRG